MMGDFVEFLRPDERYRSLLEAMVKTACDDVRTYCRQEQRGEPKNQYAAKKSREYSRTTALKSLAWLTGIRSGYVSIDATCDALGVNQYRLLDCLEESIGADQFDELSSCAKELFSLGAN